MNKIEINEAFLEQPLLQYDAGAIILEDMILSFTELNEENKVEFRKCIEGSIGDFTSFLKKRLSDMPKEELYSSSFYQTIFGVFYHLKNEGLISQENINYFGTLIGIEHFPVTKKGIKNIKKEISYYITFCLENGNDIKGTLENKSRQLFNLKDYNSAIEIEKDIINFHGGNYCNYETLGDYYGYIGDHENSLSCYIKASYHHPDSKKHYDADKKEYSHAGTEKYNLKIGHAFYGLEQYDKALMNYVSHEKPEDIGLNRFMEIGQKIINEGENFLARDAFKKAIEIDSSSTNAFACLGLSFYNTKEFEEAAVYFKEVINLENKPRKQSYLNLYLVYYDMKYYSAAEDILQELIIFFPNNKKYKEMLSVTQHNIEKSKFPIIGHIGKQEIQGNFG